MYRVWVYNENYVEDNETRPCLWFGFNSLANACEFAQTCIECGDEGTVVSIREKKED